jgi:hypothetical protein
VPAKRAPQQHERRARAVGERHRHQSQLADLVLGKTDEQIVRQRGKCVPKRLARMAARIEAELHLEPRQASAKDGHARRLRVQRLAGPQARMDRKRGDLPAASNGRHDEVERNAAVNARQAIGFGNQRRGPPCSK